MAKIHRKDFSGGWQPDADNVNAPKNAMLRAKNLVLDENGVLSVRRGSVAQNATATSTFTSIYNIHTCYLTPPTQTTKERQLVRLVGCGDALTSGGDDPSDEGKVYWLDQSTAPQTLGVDFPVSTVSRFDGAYTHDSFDIHMIDTMDRIYMARGTVKKKWDGSTSDVTTWEDGNVSNVTNWGLSQTGAKPTLAARGNPDSRTIVNCDAITNWAYDEDDGTGPTTDSDKVEGTNSLVIVPAAATARAVMTYDINTAYSGTLNFLAWPNKPPESVRKTVDVGVSYTDYTSEAGDSDAATHVVLSSLDTLANGDWVVVGCTNFKFTTITVTMDAAVNANASTLAAHYWDGSAWSAVSSLVDDTGDGDNGGAAGATFGESGSITFDEPTDWVQNTIDNVTAYHIRLTVSAALDASTQADAVLVTALDYMTQETNFNFWVAISEPKTFRSMTVYVDCNDGKFNSNYFTYTFKAGETRTVRLEPEEIVSNDQFWDWYFEKYPADSDREEVESFLESRDRVTEILFKEFVADTESKGLPVNEFVEFKPSTDTGWNPFSIAMGKFKKVGNPKWSQVYKLRFSFDTDAAVNLDVVYLFGGGNNPTTGKYKYRYSYVSKQLDADDNVLYYIKSAPSDASDALQVHSTGVNVTIPSDASRDTQVDEIWIYRIGGYLDNYYRVGKIVSNTGAATTALGTGAFTFFDVIPDVNALIENEVMEYDLSPPPDDMIGLAGPYYSRTYCLTQEFLYPSRVREPENYVLGEALRIAEEGERAWWIAQALGGLYIGTNKTIKRLDGTGVSLPDGTIDFTLRDTNVRPAPVSSAVAQEGNSLLYLAEDGWRAFNGVSSTPIYGETSLLYSGHTRHDVSIIQPGDLTARYRAIIAKGALWALTPTSAPAGADSYSSASDIFRFDFQTRTWAHFVTPWSLKSIHLEPDGDILIGNNQGFVYKFDSGTQDDGVDIAVVLWTHFEDNDQPDQRKDPYDYKIRLDTGGADATITLHADGSSTVLDTITANTTSMAAHQEEATGLGTFTQVQQKITGSFSTFKLYDYTLQYRERPEIREYWENRPESPHPTRRRFGGLTAIVDTLSAAATITPVLDDTDQTAQSITSTDSQVEKIHIDNVIGRDLWARIEKSDGFEVYDVEPIVVETLPEQTKGLGPKMNAGSEAEKVISGIKIKVCTLGASVVFTPYMDGEASDDTFTLTTGDDEPVTEIFNFTSTQTVTDIALHTDGLVELYGWEPEVLYEIPAAKVIWDTGPICDFGRADLVWIREIKVKCKSPSNLIVQPFLDDSAFGSYTHDISPYIDRTTVFTVPVGREFKGRVPRVVVKTVDGKEFNPYWVEFYFRPSGFETQKKPFRVMAK